MHRIVHLYQSSVGKKVVMAVTGLFAVGWLVGHMTGNLKVFLGSDAQGVHEIDHYAEWLKEMGSPVLPHGVGLWIVRILLIGAIVLHMASAFSLYRQSKAARPGRYAKEEPISFSYASRTMRWGGVIIVLYVVYHLLHLTVGSAHPDFVPGAVYDNLVIAFQSPLVVAAYAIANVALGLHLYHGIWSLTQTLGLSHPRYDHLRRPVAGGISVVLVVGFLSVPVAILTGFVS
jgi:succinate dehydrogenase / fumarate reductase cytochrome b subunit